MSTTTADQRARGVTITKVTPVRHDDGESDTSATGRWSRTGRSSTRFPGRLRLKNPAIHRKGELCQAIERELMSVLGVDSYKTSPLTSTVLVYYDPKELTRDQIIEIIDECLGGTPSIPLTRTGPICICRCARSRYRWPPSPSSPRLALLPVAAVLFAYTSIPTFKNAREVLFEEKRLGVDVLDAIVVVGCLGRCLSSRERCSAGASASVEYWSRRRRTIPRSCF